MATATRDRRVKVPDSVVFRIAQRDNWTCHVCDQGFDPRDPWEIDHDQARARFGTYRMSNLKLAHRSCNNGKGAA